MVQAGNDRWVEVSPSQFPHEVEGLALLRAILPDETPFRAWSNFEFRDSRGRWHEVDALVLGRGQPHLIELKHYYGTLSGDDQRWIRNGGRSEDSPLKLARRKAQYFATKLKDELSAWARETRAQIPDQRDIIPFVQESVFLHHAQFRCLLPPSSAIGLYGLDGEDAEKRSNLPGISKLVLEPAGRRAIGANQEQILIALLARIGLVQRREREAGSWVIQDGAIDSGEGWQDWLASHKVVQSDQARIHFQVLPAGASQAEQGAVRKLAENEFRVMSRLQHDGLIQPRDLVESELGVGLVYPYNPDWQRLDLWLAGQPNGVSLATQLAMIRQIGETLQYAHNNRVVHRGLSPQAVWVRYDHTTAGDVKVRVGDWELAGSSGPRVTRAPGDGVTQLAVKSAGHEGYTAPEGLWAADADRVRLDVFAFGALAFYLLTGADPATSQLALKQRLLDQNGIDLAIELPQVSSALRSLVLKATNPAPSQRTADITTALAQLTHAERESATGDATDPLEAVEGTVLDGRFRLIRRLGQGSTAVGLLVHDGQADGPDDERVLKVALDDQAGARLADEAEVLGRFANPRIVKLLEGPLVVGGRRALLLEKAGDTTLSAELRTRRRLSLDLLERYGTDLLDALVALDQAGVDHRDLKPSNLGVREGRGDRTKHLVLFDFSLTKAAASATSAGTPPYLDPFLVGQRDRYDSAAERYAAAVVLFEMATGSTPVYGDGQSDPASIADDATIEPAMFDPAVADALMGFFESALARQATARPHTAEAMRASWRGIFATDATTEPDESNDELAAQATLSTLLRDSGLTARALSALEPLTVQTVGELLTIDPVGLSSMRGVANATRLQITARVKEWKARLGDDLPSPGRSTQRPTPEDAADLLIQVVATSRAASRGGIARLVLGLGTDLDAFATYGQLGASLSEPVTQARASQLLTTLQEQWAKDDDARALLDVLAEAVSERLVELGHVATVSELTRTVVQSLAPQANPDERLARGLLRFALERRRAMHRADGSQGAIWLRRRSGIVTLLAEDQTLFDLAESLGAEADRLVTGLGDPTRELLTAARVRPRLAELAQQLPQAVRESLRPISLAAAASTHAAASGAGELHHRDLSQVAALGYTFAGFGGQALAPEEIRERVRVRFPAVPDLPERPTLDGLVADADLGLVFDQQRRLYRSREADNGTSGLEPRSNTSLPLTTAPVASTGALGVRLETSIASRSFLALGVQATKIDRLIGAARGQYRADVVDLTGLLLDALKTSSASFGLEWNVVLEADALAENSTEWRGLSRLVEQAWPEVEAAIDRVMSDETADGSPVLLTDTAPLARYGNMPLLSRWTDLAASRRRAVWLLVPQLGGNYGPKIDGRPVPLSAPNQFVPLDNDWVDGAAAAALALEGS